MYFGGKDSLVAFRLNILPAKMFCDLCVSSLQLKVAGLLQAESLPKSQRPWFRGTSNTVTTEIP
jgi:hypothetical protein